MCSPPTLTDCQLPAPTSSRIAKRRTDVVGSEHATSTPTTAAATGRTLNGDLRRMNESGGRARLRAAIIFGIVAATLEMGVLLWMMNC